MLCLTSIGATLCPNLSNDCHGQANENPTFVSSQGHHLNPRLLRISASSFNRRRIPSNRSRGTDKSQLQNHRNSPSDQYVGMVIDVDDIKSRVSMAFRRVLTSYEARVHGVLISGKEAFRDLQTLVMIDNNNRIIISCRRSSLQFMANAVVWSVCVVIVVRFLVKVGSGWSWGIGFGNRGLIRRDRSLGGREVVVGSRVKGRDTSVKGDLISPLSPVQGIKIANAVRNRVSKVETLPTWWPESLPSPVVTVGKQEFQREADGIIRAILDNRMSGKDHTEDDVIQLRRICRTSGARVSIATANARDSFYRASVEFVLNTCSSSTCHPTLVQIDGEDAPQFIAGLAESIGLENIRAARIVSAAVAARTRARFLQAWALEIQGKRPDVLEELLKICRIHQIFPPEEHSPEMEMVAHGLENHLKMEQRKQLLNLYIGVCGTRSQRIAAEALGLILPPKEDVDRVISGSL